MKNIFLDIVQNNRKKREDLSTPVLMPSNDAQTTVSSNKRAREAATPEYCLSHKASSESVKTIAPRRKLARTVARSSIKFTNGMTDTRTADELFAPSSEVSQSSSPPTKRGTIPFPSRKPSAMEFMTKSGSTVEKPTLNELEQASARTSQERPTLSRTASTINVLASSRVEDVLEGSTAAAMSAPLTRSEPDGFDISETHFQYDIQQVDPSSEPSVDIMDLEDEDFSLRNMSITTAAQPSGDDNLVLRIEPYRKDVEVWETRSADVLCWSGTLVVANASGEYWKPTWPGPRFTDICISFTSHKDGASLTDTLPPEPELRVESKGAALTRREAIERCNNRTLSEICVDHYWQWRSNMPAGTSPADTNALNLKDTSPPGFVLDFYVPIPMSLWSTSQQRCDYRRFRVDACMRFLARPSEMLCVRAEPVVVGVDRLYKVKHVDGKIPLDEMPVNTFGVRKTRPTAIPTPPPRLAQQLRFPRLMTDSLLAEAEKAKRSIMT